MLVYEGIKTDFLRSVETDTIAVEIEENIYNKMHRATARNEFRSWENSLEYMYKVLNDKEIPDDSGIAIEYNIPQTSKRVDFLISGYDKEDKSNVVIIELKQWDKINVVKGLDALVETYTGNALRQVVHPSYQAWSYAMLIKDYNQTVQNDNIILSPCSYLHNYRRQENDPLDADWYDSYLEEAPAFTRGEVDKLRLFIKKSIVKGDNKELLYRIENGKIRPSKSLQDSLAGMLKGNKEFIMIDEQKVVYEEILQVSKRSQKDGKKRVVIVKGGPGTGKTVVAINLLSNLTCEEQFCQYVSKNSAPRNVYQKKLKGQMKKSSVDNMFKGSGIYTEAPVGGVDTILVDESQRVTIKDIGSVEEIENWANKLGAEIYYQELNSQFRCNGSDGYLAWLDDVLDIRQTANFDMNDIDYDIKVIDSPQEVQHIIVELNRNDNRSRILAGYCWNWIKHGKNDSTVHDIQIGDFEMSWNLGSSTTFAIDETSINEIGCIHTSQGLEFDYVGVIIGEDMRYEGGRIITDFTKRAGTDQSLKGIKTLNKKDPMKATEIADEIIKNTYRTLMTRGMKGCYVYCVDKNLANYLKTRLKGAKE